MEPVRWGILSTAGIATKKVIPGMLKSKVLVVLGLASRDLQRAKAAAAELGIARAYGSYEAMLADPDIEAIYNPLPNHLHVPLTLAAAQAGKHVLCEKPMAMNAAELEALRPYASKVHLREAFMVRQHPQWIDVRDRVRRGAIGELRFMQVGFSYFNDDPSNIRNQADIGGGALYDIGCYAIVAGRWFFEAEVRQVHRNDGSRPWLRDRPQHQRPARLRRRAPAGLRGLDASSTVPTRGARGHAWPAGDRNPVQCAA